MSAAFTIVVGDDRTSVHVQADPGTDPQHAIALAIGCLQAEMADLRKCPVHRATAGVKASGVTLPKPAVQRATWDGSPGWTQYHDEHDPLPAEWDGEPPDVVKGFYSGDQVRELLSTPGVKEGEEAKRTFTERWAKEEAEHPDPWPAVGVQGMSLQAKALRGPPEVVEAEYDRMVVRSAMRQATSALEALLAGTDKTVTDRQAGRSAIEALRVAEQHVRGVQESDVG